MSGMQAVVVAPMPAFAWLADRYSTPLPNLVDEVTTPAVEVQDAARDRLAYRKYPALTETEIKTLVVDDKWMARLSATVQGELDRVSQTLTGRIRELAERYATRLPTLIDDVEALARRVDEHLQKMGFER